MATLYKTNYFENLNRILTTSDCQPMIFLANPTGEALSAIKVFNSCKSELSFIDKDTLSFSVPEHYFDIYSGEYVRTLNYDDIVKYRLLYTNGLGIYVIMEVTDTNDGLSRAKEVTAYSYEYSLSFKPADIFSTVSSEDATMELTLLQILNSCYKQTGWSYILSDNLKSLQRTFDDEINENWWDFLTSTVSDAFDCFFIFDNFSKCIYGYTQSEFEEDYRSNLFLTHDYLLNEVKVTEVSDNITTVMKVEGTDFDISEVNPLGSYIYNFDYFMNTKWMSEELIGKIKAWQEKVESLRPMYADLMMVKNYLIKMKNDCIAQASIYRAEKNAVADRLSTITDNNVIIKDFGAPYGKVSYSGALNSTWSGYHARERMYYVEDDETAPSNYADIMSMINTIDKFTGSPGGTPSDRIIIYTSIEDKILVLPTRVWSISRNPNPNGYVNHRFFYFTVNTDDTSASTPVLTWTVSPAHQLADGSYAYGYFVKLYSYFSNTEESNIVQSHLHYAYNVISDVKDENSNHKWFSYKTDDNGNRIPIWSLSDIRHMCAFERFFTKEEIVELQKFMIYDTYTDDNYAQENLTNNSILPTRKRNLANQLYNVGAAELRRKSFPKYTYEVDVNNFVSLDEYKSFCEQLSMGHTINIEMPNSEIATPSLSSCSIDFDNISSLTLEFANARDVKSNEISFNSLFRNKNKKG